jgi:hypothetical protein
LYLSQLLAPSKKRFKWFGAQPNKPFSIATRVNNGSVIWAELERGLKEQHLESEWILGNVDTNMFGSTNVNYAKFEKLGIQERDSFPKLANYSNSQCQNTSELNHNSQKLHHFRTKKPKHRTQLFTPNSKKQFIASSFDSQFMNGQHGMGNRNFKSKNTSPAVFSGEKLKRTKIGNFKDVSLLHTLPLATHPRN